MDREARPSPQAWDELRALALDESNERGLLERLIELWREAFAVAAVALYSAEPDGLVLVAVAGDGMPPTLAGSAAGAVGEADSALPGLQSLRLPAGLLCHRSAVPADVAAGTAAEAAADLAAAPSHPLTLLLTAALRGWRLRQELKEQQFQVNYRVVELEALYDVGLAIAGTLDLGRLAEEILLRAVSLLDARRGALYLLEGAYYRQQQTFGGEAAEAFAATDEELHAFLVSGEAAPAGLLPGARYLLGVAIEVESGRRGLLVVGDKESRRGVGPFLTSDRRTLSMFANQAALALENARLHLQALEKERLEREMFLAADIQRQILPKGSPHVPGFELCGWNRPARQVGGDYYDLFLYGEDRVGLLVGDVSGKGIAAALLVSILHSGLHLLLHQTGFGPTLLERLNQHLLESSTPNKFVTLLLAELAPRASELRYINAGHNPGVLLRSGGAVEELGSSGVPLGLLPVARYREECIRLEHGDLVCLYSDGITEAESPSEEEFGMGRLIEVLLAHRERPLAEMQEAILQAVAEFSQGRPQGDDQTLVLLRREP
jgi:sigma-B regulation protein RsbU (phosphoserine phosphatase)